MIISCELTHHWCGTLSFHRAVNFPGVAYRKGSDLVQYEIVDKLLTRERIMIRSGSNPMSQPDKCHPERTLSLAKPRHIRCRYTYRAESDKIFEAFSKTKNSLIWLIPRYLTSVTCTDYGIFAADPTISSHIMESTASHCKF